MPEDANIPRLRADAIKVAAGREGIALVLGTYRSPRLGEQQVEVQPSERLVMSLPTAKRLYVLLRDVLRDLGREREGSDVEARDPARLVGGDAMAPPPHRDILRGNDTALARTYTNTTDVTGSRDAVDISFGVEQAHQAGQDGAPVEPVRLVTLHTTVAEHLAGDLNEAIKSHETTRAEPEPVADFSVAHERVESDEGPRESGSEERAENVLTLFRQVGRLDAKIDFEPSIKIVANQLFENRFLLGFDRRDTAGSSDDRIASICENIGMPSSLLVSFKEGLADANHVYFGVEKSDQALLFKAYLEFRDNVEKEIGGAAVTGRSYQLFTGFKWDSFLPARHVVSRYFWYPSLSVEGMLERVEASIDAGGRDTGLLEFARRIAKRASQRISRDGIQYLEVAEEDNPRRSFDMNIYKSAFTLEDVCPDLLRALRWFDVPFSRFESLYQRIKAERFGHLAGGVDRENNDFMTVYYGVKDIHSSQLAAATIVQQESPPRPRW